MWANEDTIIELHSERCRCRGYGWNARRGRLPVRTACCPEGQVVPMGAAWVPSTEWLALGMPRTVEQYYRAQSEQATAGAA